MSLCSAHDTVVLLGVERARHGLERGLLGLLDLLQLRVLIECLLIHGEFDGIRGGFGAQIIHSRLEPLLPAIKVHRRQFPEIRIIHMNIERLRLIDESPPLRRHIDQRLLRDLPHRFVNRLQIRGNLIQILHRPVGGDEFVFEQRRPNPERNQIAQQMAVDAHELARQRAPHIHIRRVRLKALVIPQNLRSRRRGHRRDQQRIAHAIFRNRSAQRRPIEARVRHRLEIALFLLIARTEFVPKIKLQFAFAHRRSDIGLVRAVLGRDLIRRRQRGEVNRLKNVAIEFARAPNQRRFSGE